MKKLLFIWLVSLSVVEGFSQDSTNTFDYLYRRGMKYYNKGVDIVNKTGKGEKTLEYVQPSQLDSMNKEAKEEFKKALPFLLKAYTINSKNEKLLSALQGVHFSLYDFKESDRYKKEFEALPQDSTNVFYYNYKKGMEHYNKGVDILNKRAFIEEPMEPIMPDSSKIEFNLALPFLLKAYSINNKEKKILIALQGVYFSMYDFEKSDRFKKEVEALIQSEKK